MSGERRQSPLREIAGLFLRLGATAFGGPAAHIAMMEHEVVRRRRWLTREEFLDYLGATNLIPAAAMVLAAAWAYVTFGALPEAAALLYGVKPVVIAVVAQALWGLARTCLKTSWIALVAALSVGLLAADVHELLVLFGAGLLVAAGTAVSGGRGRLALLLCASCMPATAGGVSALGSVAAAPSPFGLLPLFLVFARIGAVLFGSGYVLLAFVRAELVERLGWLTEQQLLDATAIGQVTPGPVFTTATFIGYLLGGTRGAAVATLGIFLPAFIFVAISGPLVPRIRRSTTAAAALDGVNAASLALMVVVSWQLAQAALVDTPAVIMAAAALVALIRYRVNPAWLVAGGGLAGLAIVGLAG
jgi:chromate transporter